MRVEPCDILDLVHGALYTTVTAEGEINFARFGEEQRDNYAISSPLFLPSCDTSAGITLEFYSNTSFLSFEASFSKVSDCLNFGNVDLWVDDVLFDCVIAQKNTTQTVRFSLPEGEHRITVYLPWRASSVLRNLETDTGASLIPVEKGKRILAIGDSITQGYDAAHPSMTYVSHMARRLNAEVLNQGVGGYQFFKESLVGAPDWQPDLVTLAYGTNDFVALQTAKEFEERVRAYMEILTATYPDTPILAITPIYRGDRSIDTCLGDKDYSFLDAINILHNIYAEYPQVNVLDGLSFFPHHADFLLPDLLHPSDLGFAVYGQAVCDEILKMG